MTLGEVLGCGAHLASLRRLNAGDLNVDRALSADRVEELIKEGRAGEALLPLEALLPGLPKVVLTETGEGRRPERPVVGARRYPEPSAARGAARNRSG